MNARFIPTIQHYTYRSDGKVKATIRHSIDDDCTLCKEDEGMAHVKIIEKEHWRSPP